MTRENKKFIQSERSVLDRLRVSALAVNAVIGGLRAAPSGDEQDVFGL